MAVDPIRAVVAMTPTFLLVGVVVLHIVRDPVALIALTAAALVTTIVAYLIVVPLRIDQLSNATIVANGIATVAARRARR